QPERLVAVYETFENGGWGNASFPNFRDWRERSRSWSHLVAFATGGRNLEGGDEPQRVSAVAATADLFAMLGVRPLLGRTFAKGGDEPGRDQVAVLAEGTWRARFGADPHVVGRTVVLDGKAYTVVGVVPASFSFPARWDVDVWVPLAPTGADAEAR